MAVDAARSRRLIFVKMGCHPFCLLVAQPSRKKLVLIALFLSHYEKLAIIHVNHDVLAGHSPIIREMGTS